jgi:hypothetical protein
MTVISLLPLALLDGNGPHLALEAPGARAVQYLLGAGLGEHTGDHSQSLSFQLSLHSASAVPCEPGTSFSGEPGQCVPCVSGTYQDMEGQLSCTPCPSSDGLGLAGARNVSECGGKCGLPGGRRQRLGDVMGQRPSWPYRGFQSKGKCCLWPQNMALSSALPFPKPLLVSKGPMVHSLPSTHSLLQHEAWKRLDSKQTLSFTGQDVA